MSWRETARACVVRESYFKEGHERMRNSQSCSSYIKGPFLYLSVKTKICISSKIITSYESINSNIACSHNKAVINGTVYSLI